MAGIITKRSEEEVREWLIERIDRYQLDTEDNGLVIRLEDIKEDIKDNQMLTKVKARLLDKLVSQDATEVLGRGNDRYRTAIQYIDELSIYSDVWQMYLRPGSYTIEI